MGGFKNLQIAQADAERRAVTLAELDGSGLCVFCWCNRCGHQARLPTALLRNQLGPEFPVPDIGSHLRCSSCGSKDVATGPDQASPSRTALCG